ncbi:Heat shock transcription factor, X-linked member 3 [Galemys pyrenaicus]|uniref:Heat shock transcription factor, X-linked member 3 n=1 Tax=Galemys pyrenaicus TaxID=202257 RepID=A0A8J6AVE7_GALPY|nr:Heat shock transcription factor, X-linked member 3 [Galemys pyrenaicus]
MANPSVGENPKAQLDLAVATELPAAGPSEASPEPEGGSGEAAGRGGDPTEGPDPGPQEDPQPRDPPAGAANPGEDVLGLPFPRRLWRVVEDNSLASVGWNEDGNTVVIHKGLFRTEVLQRSGPDRLFETDCFRSFVWQLRLHGFSKLRSPKHQESVMYRNCRFLRDKPELVDSIERRGGPRPAGYQGPRRAAPKRKRQEVPTRRSARLLHLNANKEAQQEAQQEAPAAQGPGGSPPARLSDTWPVGGVEGRPKGGRSPTEAGGPSGEGTSRNVTLVPQMPADQEGAGELPSSPPGFPERSSALSVYNICYSILLAALLVMAPHDDPEEAEEEQEQEGPSEDSCTLCEQFEENPSP